MRTSNPNSSYRHPTTQPQFQRGLKEKLFQEQNITKVLVLFVMRLDAKPCQLAFLRKKFNFYEKFFAFLNKHIQALSPSLHSFLNTNAQNFQIKISNSETDNCPTGFF